MIGDTKIIEMTKIETLEDGTAMLTYEDGADPIQQRASNEEAARKHIIAWCDHVRQMLDARQQAREDEKVAAKRRRDDGTIRKPEEMPYGQPPVDPSDPIEYARAQRDTYQDKVNEAETQVTEWKVTRKKARENLENWEKILESLRHEQDD